MSERAFWPSNPDALLTSAAQAVEAKNGLGRFLGRSWDYVDAHLPEVLLVTLERLPQILASFARKWGGMSSWHPWRRGGWGRSM